MVLIISYIYNNFNMGYTYNANNNITSTKYNLDNINRTVNYNYDSNNRISSVNYDNNTLSYNYDYLSRLTSKKINNSYTTTYNYKTVGNNTSTILTSISNNNENISYTYDNNGNILTISKNNTLTNTYYYDQLNQLIKEDNVLLNKTIEYSYDLGGNITSKKYYDYKSTNMVNEINYSYDNVWKDLLTNYNGKAITYDTIGNMTSYDGYNYTWNTGRRLGSISNGVNNYSYTYNEDGIRTSKNIKGVIINYYLEGNNVIL